MAHKQYRSALITGGAGFIGTKLMPRLMQLCDRAVIFDNLLEQVHGPDASAPMLGADVDFVRGDMRDREAVAKVVAEVAPDLIVHLAAETGTGQSYDEISRYCEVNVQGTAYLAEALRGLASESRRRVVLASSRAVYGEGAYQDAEGGLIVPPPRSASDMAAGRFLPQDDRGQPLRPLPTPEDVPLAPGSIYASTKLMQEYLLTQAFAATNIDLVTLRFQNVYGPGQSLRNPYTGVLSIFGSIALSGQSLNIFEDGDIVRDFVHAEDVVRAIVASATVERPSTLPINIGTGQGVTILQAAQLLLVNLGCSPDALAVSGDFRVGDIRYARADIARAGTLLNWSPQITIEQGIAELARWIVDSR